MADYKLRMSGQEMENVFSDLMVSTLRLVGIAESGYSISVKNGLKANSEGLIEVNDIGNVLGLFKPSIIVLLPEGQTVGGSEFPVWFNDTTKDGAVMTFVSLADNLVYVISNQQGMNVCSGGVMSEEQAAMHFSVITANNGSVVIDTSKAFKTIDGLTYTGIFIGTIAETGEEASTMSLPRDSYVETLEKENAALLYQSLTGEEYEDV